MHEVLEIVPYDDEAREYEDLKRRLAPRYSATDLSSRERYADAKTEFIIRVMESAFAAGYPRAL